MKFKFGSKVKDIVTGVSGVVIGFCTYMTGCDQYLVQPINKKDKTKRPKGIWFDVDRLKQVKSKKISIKRKPNNGCDIPAPTK